MPVSRTVAERELQDTAGAGGNDVTLKLSICQGGRIHQREYARASEASREIIGRPGIKRKPEGDMVILARNSRDVLSEKAFG